MARANERRKVIRRCGHSQRRDRVPVSGGSLRIENQNRANSSGSSLRNLIGQPVCGYLDGIIENGYRVTIQVGIEGPIFKGFVFDPHRCPPAVMTDFAETSTRASVTEPRERPIQTFVQPLSRNQPATAAVQRIHQNATPSPTLLQHLQQNNNASGQAILGRGPAFREPAQPVQQPVGVLQRNGPARSFILGLPARQNIGVVQPIQINQPDTPARSVQNSGRGIQPLPRYESVEVLPPSLHPMRMSSRTAQRIRRTAPSIPTRGYQRAALPYARNLCPNHDRHSLQSDSRRTALRAATNVAANNADPIGSPVVLPPQSQIENSLTTRTEGRAAAFAEGERVIIITPNSQPNGYSSGNFSGNMHSNNTPNADEILQGARGLFEPRTLPEDVCLGHPSTSTEVAPQASTSHGDPNRCPTCGKMLLDLNL